MDIGQPADYLTGMRLYLGHLYECKSPLLTVDPNLIGNVLVVSFYLRLINISFTCGYNWFFHSKDCHMQII